MTDETSSQILEYMCKFERTLAEMRADRFDMRKKLRAISRRLSHFEEGHTLIDHRLDRLEAHATRIEKRLDLVEG
jgi:hypothetical protein